MFHAAAYKHVPMMEEYPQEAIWSNTIGTYETARAAAETLGYRRNTISVGLRKGSTNTIGFVSDTGQAVKFKLQQDSGVGIPGAIRDISAADQSQAPAARAIFQTGELLQLLLIL